MEKKDLSIFEGDRALNYDSFVTTWIPHYQDLISYLPKIFINHILAANRPILIAGCGTGNELLSLSKAMPDRSFLGVDPSPAMIAQARQKLSNTSQVQVQDGYVADLPVANQFSAASLLLVLHFLPDDGAKLALLQDIGKRLAPGAPLIIADIFGSPTELVANLEMLRSMLPPTLTTDEINNRLIRITERINYISELRLDELLVNSGFKLSKRFFQAAIYGAWLTTKQ